MESLGREGTDDARRRSVGDRVIEGRGTPEREWRRSGQLDALPGIGVDELAPARVVVVAPHPDDEVLACGGLLSLLARIGRPVTVVAVTDGEASHPGSTRWSPGLLAARRREERERGLERLGIASAALSLVSLGIPDGGVVASEAALHATLSGAIEPGDAVFTTWRLDGHPDHEATGRATAAACTERGARLWEVPVWTWHWARPGDARVPWTRLRRLPLDADARLHKSRAIAAHGTQLMPSPAEGRAAVLADWALARLLRPFEVFIDREPLS